MFKEVMNDLWLASDNVHIFFFSFVLECRKTQGRTDTRRNDGDTGRFLSLFWRYR
jgi:hypothetical protein